MGRPPGRPITVDLYAGKVMGSLTVRGRVKTKKGVQWRVECVCGIKKTVPAHYLLRASYPMTNCGCLKYKDANPYPREKGIWQMMHVRTENPNHVSYAYYGGAGVRVHADFHKDNPQGWDNFIKHVGPAPTKKHTLDRIDPRKGYEPGNLRWATKKEQSNNQRRHWEGKPE